MTMAFMSLNGIDVSYDKKKQILKGLNLEVEEGELVSLLGPSGCGKSTTLRVVAGFIDPQGGTFTLDGEDMTKVPVHKRQFGLVFQSYALFPHLSVYDNVAFGLRTRKMDKDVIDKKVREILEVCGLTELADRFPKQMSGGQHRAVRHTGEHLQETGDRVRRKIHRFRELPGACEKAGRRLHSARRK